MTKQIALQREQMEASTQAHVYPWVATDWVMETEFWVGGKQLAMLPLKNGGPGLALNVQGRVVWNLAPGRWQEIAIDAGSIAPSDPVNARISEPAATGWPGATGYVRYYDLSGRGWVTFFRFDEGLGGLLVGQHLPPEAFTPETDPDRLDAASIAAKMR